MASNMSGLASLAMAIDHLDEVKKHQMKSPVTVLAQNNNDTVVPAHHSHHPHPWDSRTPTRVALPRPQAPIQTRIVSVESEQQHSLKTTTPTRTSPPTLSSMEEEAELRAILENTCDEPPPPPPPSPDQVIDQVKENDVLCGRGGETNNHVGNITYRDLVKKYQRQYLKAKRRVKPKIARAIVDTIRRAGGRFLKKIPSENTWRDVGNTKAREKTSQALREGAPELRVDGVVAFKKKKAAAPPPHHQQFVYYQPQDYKKRKQSPTDMLGPISPDATLVSPTPSSGSCQDQYVRSVSADDDDSQGSGSFFAIQPMPKKQKRGPRLAILKARLQES